MSPRNQKANQRILDRRRSQILNAALQVFAERGLAAAKISDIASAGGVSHGLIYHYFKTKDDIFTELIGIASKVFLDAAKYGSNCDVQPLSKIRTMTEMILALSYSEDSKFYLNLLEQAHISEGIPQEAKKIIAENISSNIKLITSIIAEGQEQGQIIQEDPQKLALAYYSMVRGMTRLQSKMRDFSDLPASFADSEIIIRALKDSSYQGTTSIPLAIRNPLGALQYIDKTCVYRTRINEKNGFLSHRERITKSVDKDMDVYRIETRRETGEWMIALIRADNLMPVRVEFGIGEKKGGYKMEYGDQRVLINNPLRGIQKEILLAGRYYDNSTVPQILQAFPFESSEKIQINLVMDGSYGLPVGLCPIEIQNIGSERIRVPAGEFYCHKLELSPTATDIDKVYYWYPVDEPRFYIRSDFMGVISELLETE
jgi:AcrR family transcriptional regulator